MKYLVSVFKIHWKSILPSTGCWIELCDEVTCQFGGVCQYEGGEFVGCVCNFTCDAVRYRRYLFVSNNIIEYCNPMNRQSEEQVNT